MVEFRQPSGLVQIVGFCHRFSRAGNNLLAGQGMVLHLGILFVGELAGLVQQGVGHLDFAHVVERCGLDHVADILVRQHVGVDALPAQLLHDDAGVGRRLFHMVAGVFVPAFHHIRQHHDQAVLHAGDGGVFLLHILDVPGHILGGFGKGPVEILDLIPGVDIQAADGLHVQLLVRILPKGEFARGDGHGVEGQDQAGIRHPEADGNDEHGEGEEEGHGLGDEAALAVDQVDHGDIHAHIADASSRGIIQRLVNGKKPAVGIVGDDGIDLFARQQSILHGQEALVEGDHRAGFLAGGVRRVRVENHMAAVLPDQIGINILDIGGAFPNADEALLRFIVVRRGMPAGHEIPHPVGVDGVRRHIGHAHGHIGFVLDGCVVVKGEADAQRHRHHDEQSGGKEEDDAGAEGRPPGAHMPCLVLFIPAQGPLPPEDDLHPPSPFFRDKMQDSGCQDHDDRLVQQVHQEVGRELGEEDAFQPGVM